MSREDIEAMQADAARYQELKRMTFEEVSALWAVNPRTNRRFDSLIDDRIALRRVKRARKG